MTTRKHLSLVKGSSGANKTSDADAKPDLLLGVMNLPCKPATELVLTSRQTKDASPRSDAHEKAAAIIYSFDMNPAGQKDTIGSRIQRAHDWMRNTGNRPEITLEDELMGFQKNVLSSSSILERYGVFLSTNEDERTAVGVVVQPKVTLHKIKGLKRVISEEELDGLLIW